jgi:stage III sporulation protein AB
MAERLNERSRTLRLLIRLLNILKTEMGFHTGLLAEVFQRAAQVIHDPEMAVSLTKISQNIGFGSDFDIEQLWDDFINHSQLGALLKEDLTVLKELGAYFGSTDRKDQIEKIEAARYRLEINLEAADINRTKQVGLYRYFGFAAGAAMVCLLL